MNKLLFVLAIILIPDLATAGAMDDLKGVLDSSIAGVTKDLQKIAITWLASFAAIQMVVTNYGLLKSGADIEAVFGKLIGSLLWFCFCIYVVLNGADVLAKVSKDFFKIAGGISGAVEFSAAEIFSSGANSAGKLLSVLNKASSYTDMFMVALISGIIALLVMATAAFIGFKVFIIQIEAALIVMIAPLSFAFLGLNALKDQGIAPFKSLISLLYRVILLAILVKSMSTISQYLDKFSGTINSGNYMDQWGALFSVAAAYALIGFLVYKSDSIAASLASGSTNLGTADVAGAAAMGAALGAAVASGGASVAGAAAKSGQSMSDFMKNMNSSSVSNAGQQGAGGPAKPDSAPSPSSPSMASQGGGNDSGGSPGSGGGEEAAPDPRQPESASDAAPTAGGSGQVLGLGASAGSDAHAALAKAGAQVPAATTSPWQGGGNSKVGGAAPEHPADSSSAGGASAPDEAGDGDGFGADLKDEMAQTKAAGAALQTTPLKPSGSGASAAIGGGDMNADIKKEMARMADQMAIQGKPRKPTFGERFGKVNDHIAKEHATTQVSINANASD